MVTKRFGLWDVSGRFTCSISVKANKIAPNFHRFKNSAKFKILEYEIFLHFRKKLDSVVLLRFGLVSCPFGFLRMGSSCSSLFEEDDKVIDLGSFHFDTYRGAAH